MTQAEDARRCRAVAATHARTFWIASRLLPERKRRGAFAIYATCRRADDLVDNRMVARDDAGRRALAGFREEAFRAFEFPSHDPILRELARAVAAFGVPVSALTEVFDGVASDLDAHEFRSWAEVEQYCEAVAGSVGEMTCAVFGVGVEGERAAAVACARTLGVAMQLTNILRDVGEDARRGRCYLPSEELEAHGLRREQVLDGTVLQHGTAWQSFMRFQVARARRLYRKAVPGIALLAPDARRCALACAAGYARILDAAEHLGFDTVSQRVSASRLTLLRVAWQSWLGRVPDFATDEAPVLDEALPGSAR